MSGPKVKGGVKKGGDAEDHRRRRETRAITLRKEKREEGVQNRRRVAAENAAETATSQLSSVPAELNLDHLPLYCEAARSDDAVRQLEGVTCVRRLLSKENNPPVEAVLKANILSRLVQLLATATGNVKLQFEAAWAITNIASTEYTRVVVEAGAIAPLVAGMMSGDPALRDQCIWCIGNVAGDCAKYRDMVLNTPGALQALLLNIQQPDNLLLLRNATWTLSNFCRGKPQPSTAMVAAMVPALAYLLGNGDREVLQDAAWGLSYLTDGDEASVQAVVDAGVARRCVELMAHPEHTVVTPALRIVGNFISGNDRQTQAALEAGALVTLTPLLTHARRNIKREACWAVSNVAAGTRDQLNLLMTTPGLMHAVVGLLGKSKDSATDWNVRKEAAWVVSNIATVGTPEHLHTLVGLGVMEPLVDLLESTRDHRILSVVLDAVDAMLNQGAKAAAAGNAGAGANGRALADAFEEAGLLNVLEQVQEFSSEEVYAKAVKIVETHYGFEEDDEEEEGQAAEAPAAAAARAFTFGSPAPNNGALGALSAAAARVNAQPVTAGAFSFGQAAACQPLITAGPAAPAAAVPAFNFGGMTFA